MATSLTQNEINAMLGTATSITVCLSRNAKWKDTERKIQSKLESLQLALKSATEGSDEYSRILDQIVYHTALQDECLEDSEVKRGHKLFDLRLKSLFAQMRSNNSKPELYRDGTLRLWPFMVHVEKY